MTTMMLVAPKTTNYQGATTLTEWDNKIGAFEKHPFPLGHKDRRQFAPHFWHVLNKWICIKFVRL